MNFWTCWELWGNFGKNVGTREAVKKFEDKLQGRFEVKTTIIGRGEGEKNEA